MSSSHSPSLAGRGVSRDLAAGLVLVAIGGVALFGAAELPFMTSQGVGSGLLPRLLGGFIVALGVAQCVVAWRVPGPALTGWALRKIAILLGSVLLFAITIRGYALGPLQIPPLGLVVASPLAILVAGHAARDTRIAELAAFAVAITAACVVLFRFALGLPVPVAPWLIGF